MSASAERANHEIVSVEEEQGVLLVHKSKEGARCLSQLVLALSGQICDARPLTMRREKADTRRVLGFRFCLRHQLILPRHFRPVLSLNRTSSSHSSVSLLRSISVVALQIPFAFLRILIASPSPRPAQEIARDTIQDGRPSEQLFHEAHRGTADASRTPTGISSRMRFVFACRGGGTSRRWEDSVAATIRTIAQAAGIAPLAPHHQALSGRPTSPTTTR